MTRDERDERRAEIEDLLAALRSLGWIVDRVAFIDQNGENEMVVQIDVFVRGRSVISDCPL